MLGCLTGVGRTPEGAQSSVLDQFNGMNLNTKTIIRIETIPSTVGIWPIQAHKYTTTLWYSVDSSVEMNNTSYIEKPKRYIGS